MSDGKLVALVTGGNRGIGLEIGRQLARKGITVVLGSRDAQAGREAARALAAEGLPVEHGQLDVSSEASIDALAGEIQARHAGLDVLVNNAGIAMDGFDAEVARRTLDVNFFGSLRVTDRFLPMLRAGARVVLLSSGLGRTNDLPAALRARLKAKNMVRADLVALMRSFVADVAAGTHAAAGWPSSAYRVSKMGVNALAGVLARELAADPRKILVNAACPGWVRTAMGGAGAPRSVEEGARTPVWLATLPEGGARGGVFSDEQPSDW
jgi:carbonyl reductase 1